VKVDIQYHTQYAYEEPVSFSRHLFRLFPKADRYLSVRRLAFQTNADATVNYRRDLFDNEMASCFYPEKSALLQAGLQIELELTPRNAFGFLLESHALDLPFQYTAPEAHALSPYLQEKPAPVLPFWQPPTSPQPTIEALVSLNSALHDHLEYERRDEGAAYTPEETLRLGRGACRDFALLFAEVSRGLGLAARLASGYLCEFGSAEKRAEGALHAWTEIYLPGAGWVGFDPTNGYLCNHHHITAAVGFTPEDISPILGNYFHPTHVPASMTASLQIFPHEDSQGSRSGR
jgi:transglutaminase-like putative cysteine protease